MIEFTLALPILIIMLALIADVGRGFQLYTIVTNAAREGARYGTLYPSDTSGIQTKVRNEVGGTGITISQINTTYPSGNAAGNPIRVEVVYTFTPIFSGLIGVNSLTVRNACEMIIL